MAVAQGRDHVDLTGIRAIGIDEIHWQHVGNFLTLVHQIDPTRKRFLWLGLHRRVRTLLQIFRWLGKEGPRNSRSFAATCGSCISRSSPRRPGTPSASSTGFTSPST